MTAGSPWHGAYEAARRRWPAIVLAEARFEEHGRALGLGDQPGEPNLVDLYLACAALDGDAAALAILEAEVMLPSRTSIARVISDPAFGDDVLQELRRKLLVGAEARLARYTGRSPLEGWVRVTATRLAYDMLRAQAPRVPFRNDADLEEMAAEAAEPDLLVLKRKLGRSFQDALRQALHELAPRGRAVLRMHLVQGLSLDQIARPYGVHRATAARWLGDARQRVIEGVRSWVRDQHGPLSTEELDSLARLVASQIHLSLERLDARGESSGRNVT